MRRIAVITAAAAALLLAACGGDDNAGSSSGGSSGSSGGSATSTLKISADPGGAKKFTESSLTTKAGKVTVEFSNPSQLPHAVEIEGNGVEKETETVTGKDAAPITVDLKPGEYEFYCPVDGHRAAGMEGKLTVQ